MLKDKIESVFTKHYKILMVIPIIITIIALVLIGVKYTKTGEFFNKDVSLKGGISATVYTDKILTEEQIKTALGVDSTVRKVGDLTTGKQAGFIIEVSDLTKEQLKERLTSLVFTLTSQNYSVEETGAKLGEAFYRQLMIAILIAFLLMAITVFITFRSPIPSLAVVSAAFMDIVIPLAVVNLLGMNISTTGILSFLLIIGYSIGTDILMTSWVLKKKEEGRLFDRMYQSFVTGLTMESTAIAVMILGIIFSNSTVIVEMFTIVLIALIVDIVSTYLTNAGILWIYCKKKGIS